MTKLQRSLIAAVVIVAAGVVIILGRDPKGTSMSGQSAGSQQPAPEVVKDKPLPRLLDLGSVDCIPCKKMAPILDELAKEYAGRMKVDFIDVRKNTLAAGAHGIRVIPTQIFFAADGTELFRHEGFIAKEAILAKWAELGVTFGAAGGGGPRGEAPASGCGGCPVREGCSGAES